MRLEYWTDEQIEFLKCNYKNIGDKELAIIFNQKWHKEKKWSFKHIEKKRKYLKLKRTSGQIKKIKVRNKIRGCWADTSTWETRGEAPVGEIRIWQTTTGHLYKVIKTEEGFEHYAKWLYEKTYGPFPAGHVTGFRDRDSLNVVPENLEAITRAEHAKRNGVLRRLPDDIREVLQFINQIHQIINQKQNVYQKQYTRKRADHSVEASNV